VSGIILYDAIDLSQIPPSAQAVAGYVSGRWPTFTRLRGQFPRALLLSIAVTAGDNADCLDIETGDAIPADAAAWFLRQKARGVTRPCLYASASLMESDVVPVMRAAGIDRSAVRLWSAHYSGTPHICGQSSCRQMSIEADGTQWTNRAGGRDLDESLLLADFFDVPPAPKPPVPVPVPAWQEALMNKLPVVATPEDIAAKNLTGATSQDEPGHAWFVRRVQSDARSMGAPDWLNLGPVTDIPADGTYGTASKAAVQAIQGHYGVTQDGIVGPVTWAVLVTGSVP
jgi:peptidoglycan hydrolase-like protein with peptidoglycan-binding domain